MEKDIVNTTAFTILQDHLIPDLVNIIKDYSELPSWIYIGAEVFTVLSSEPYKIIEINKSNNTWWLYLHSHNKAYNLSKNLPVGYYKNIGLTLVTNIRKNLQ